MITWHLCAYHKRIFLDKHAVSIIPHVVIDVPPSVCEDCRTEKVRQELKSAMKENHDYIGV